MTAMLFAAFAMSAGHATQAVASDMQVTLPLTEHGMSTYYARVAVKGTDERHYMVDTGAGYTTINKAMLEELQMHELVEFKRSITAVMANGSETAVNIYSVSEITLGNNCSFKDVEVAVLPGTSRTILGMSLLKRAAPFTFNTEPPSLSLGSCDSTGNTVALGPDIDNQ
jgi:predicted aspartyl protease